VKEQFSLPQILYCFIIGACAIKDLFSSQQNNPSLHSFLEYVTTGPVFYPKDLLGGIDKALYVLWGN
jgi:hypothetical protein